MLASFFAKLRAGHGQPYRRLCTQLAALVIACGVAAPVAAETVLRTRLNSDILSSDPGTRRDENTDAVILHVVEGLVASRENGSVGPLLAESWTVSQGGRTYTFKLRQGVVFHNGAPLTADDVVWSLRRYLKPETRWRCRLEFAKDGIAQILSITAPNPQTVIITLNRAAPLFLKTLARADCGGTGILQRASVGPNGVWRKPIGTGPFMFGAWQRNQFIDLVRFPRYAALPGPRDGNTGGKHALVDRIRFLVIPDSSAALTALERGSLDILDALAPSDLVLMRGRGDIKLDMAPTLDFYAILFQTNDPLLRDARIRRAIALTLDTAGLTKAVTQGTARPDNSPIPSASPYYGPTETLRRPDLAAARRLLNEAGYHGQPISLITNRRYPQMFDIAVLVQAMAAEAGIDLEIETLDWASQFARYGSGSYQAMSFAVSAKLDPSFNFGLLIGDKTRDPRKVWGSPEAQKLLRQTMETDDPRQRQALFNTLNTAFMREVPAIILFNTTHIAAFRANVTGYKGWPAAQLRLWNVGFSGMR
ncbi:MAG: ABC transporter substrate-binding protein [Alphaproteobacteria bacterium]|nr:ABC transporter substrate-binding protein [Alphaproteobacteria bacterium]